MFEEAPEYTVYRCTECETLYHTSDGELPNVCPHCYAET